MRHTPTAGRPPTPSPTLFDARKDQTLLTETMAGAVERLLAKHKHQPERLQKLVTLFRSRRFWSRSFGLAIEATRKEAPHLLRRLKKDAPAMLADRRALFAGFEARLDKRWGRALDLLEMLLVCSSECAESLSEAWPWEESPDHSLVFDVVRQLQARACLATSEILALLRSGYASGAHARWRALHEIAVTGMFIAEHGKDVAERFLAHEAVESHKALGPYQLHSRKLGYRRFSKKEEAASKAAYDAVLSKYGKDFEKPYGWASAATRNPSPKFSDLERSVRLEHWRPFYKLASYPVHATVKTITFSMSIEPGTRILLTGPSDAGLADPGHSAAISLGQITTTMLTMHPSLDSILVGRMLGLLTDEIGQAFEKANVALKAAHQRQLAKEKTRHKQRKAEASPSP